MFIKKGVLALLLGLSFALLSSTEHLNHAFDHHDGDVHLFECQYAENSKTPKLTLNEHTIPTFSVEVIYFLNLNIHTTLLEKYFNSRAPPSLKS